MSRRVKIFRGLDGPPLLLGASIYLFYSAGGKISWLACKADKKRVWVWFSDLTYPANVTTMEGAGARRPWNRKSRNQGRQEETDAV